MAASKTEENHNATQIGSIPSLYIENEMVTAGICVDRVLGDQRILIVSGWRIGHSDIEFVEPNDEKTFTADHICYFSRDDVADGYKIDPKFVLGFLAIWRNKPQEFLRARLDTATPDAIHVDIRRPHELSRQEISQFLIENHARAGILLNGLAHAPNIVSEITRNIGPPPAGFNLARGHLEQARGVTGVGGLVAGWAFGEPDVEFFLVDDEGNVVNLDRAARWNRDDIAHSFAAEFGVYASEAGFLQHWPHELRYGGTIRLIVKIADAAFEISRMNWAAAPTEPVSFARWAFEFPTPREKFAQRLTDHDGPIVHALVKRKLALRPKRDPEILSYGAQNKNPICSIIVPLYRRHDFMLNQLLEFSHDDTIKRAAELIYVIDDPMLESPLAMEAPMLLAANDVPFKTVWGGQNRGFAGATNLGVSVSQSPLVLLMNSDVIPIESGWLDALIAAHKANPKMGAIGARLHFPNGAIQHDGMSFKWEPSWGGYLNKHPRAGLEPSAPAKHPTSPIAVTAACVLLRRKTFDAVGGLDETFLIGDFEDSDLCLKIRKLGLEIGCLQASLSLVHLERQSFSAIGAASFRDYVARYNGWKHQTRWGDYISELIANGKIRGDGQ